MIIRLSHEKISIQHNITPCKKQLLTDKVSDHEFKLLPDPALSDAIVICIHIMYAQC